MASQAKSRWADDEEDLALDIQRKRDKEAKKKAKAERQRKAEEEALQKQQSEASTARNGFNASSEDAQIYETERPSKKRKLTPEAIEDTSTASKQQPPRLLRFPAPQWGPCRHVDNFEKLNHIEEGSYGWVSRAKDINTGDVVALKKLKMDNSNDGFPVTGLREIQTLMASRHENIVALREVVMGDKLDE
ncbi:MAG: hypothetical protein OHK93_004159 [Ramalina farinacea]|uniref:cyclin-dependent kinase n=1 Tax=Ramalina farinacea TaxID=258253 RepID=A0AA43TT88_9LECA|nr:hypothetical protein [Ramalina farinacea]